MPVAPADPPGDVAVYRAALDAVPELVIGLDERCTIRFVNQQARTITGYADEDLLGASFLRLLVPDDLHAASLQSFAARRRGGAGPRGEPATIRTRAGELRDLACCVHRLTTGSGDGVAILIIGDDVTDARRAAQRVQRHQKLLAIGTLASGLAHEIRNPINAAQLHISFLRRLFGGQPAGQPADPEVLDAIAVVGEELQRVARLVSKFLAFAEPGELVKATCVVQQIVARAVAAVAVPSGIAIVLHAPAQELVIVADAERLELVVRNLLANAIDALGPGHVGEVAVRVRREPRALVLEVEDDGPGLPSPDAPVFDAFFSTKPASSGLGLAVTHRIVTDHGGTIDVESRPGRTCFRVVLPLEDEPRAAAPGRA